MAGRRGRRWPAKANQNTAVISSFDELQRSGGARRSMLPGHAVSLLSSLLALASPHAVARPPARGPACQPPKLI
jgi:hypothetical protein